MTETFNFKNTHFLLKQYYTQEFINDIYNDILKLYSAPNTDATSPYKKIHHSISGNYNYIINSTNVRDFSKYQSILNDFNNNIRNSLIENNNSFISRKFNINLSHINLSITRQNTIPTQIVKTKSINVFIPLHSFPNGGTVSIFKNTLDDDINTADIMDKYYNIDNENMVINYGKLSDYNEDDIHKLSNEEQFFDTVPGDVLIVNKNTFSRSLPNMTNEDRYCLQLIYDLSV
jgi:hypothetical protein